MSQEPVLKGEPILADAKTDTQIAKRLGLNNAWYSYHLKPALEAVKSLGHDWDFCLSYSKSEGDLAWRAVFTSKVPLTRPGKQHVLGYEQYSGQADTAPLAVCRAILDMPRRREEDDAEEAQQKAEHERSGQDQAGGGQC